METKLVREPRGSKSGQMGLGWDIAVGLGDQLAEAGRGGRNEGLPGAIVNERKQEEEPSVVAFGSLHLLRVMGRPTFVSVGPGVG